MSGLCSLQYRDGGELIAISEKMWEGVEVRGWNGNDALDNNQEENDGMVLLYAVVKSVSGFRVDEKGSRESFLRHAK